MCGRERFTICREKINFGSNMPIWNNLSGNTLDAEMSLQDGWNGLLQKKHGWPSSSLKKEWENIKMPKPSSIDTFNPFPNYKPTSKLLSLSSGTGIRKELESFLKELSLS